MQRVRVKIGCLLRFNKRNESVFQFYFLRCIYGNTSFQKNSQFNYSSLGNLKNLQLNFQIFLYYIIYNRYVRYDCYVTYPFIYLPCIMWLTTIPEIATLVS